MKLKLIFILIALTSISGLFPQIPIARDSSKSEYLRKFQIEDSLLTESDKFHRKEFYSKPPYLTIFFENNKEKINLSDNFKFIIEIQNKQIVPKRISDNQFITDSISESMTVCFIFSKDSLRFENIKYKWIKYGATLRFGIIRNIEEIRSFYRKQKRNEDFDEWSEIGQPYLRLLQDKSIKKQKRKIESIIFLGVIPRTYGDGFNYSMVKILAKKTPNP